jgi:hypothetical protein
MSVKRRSTYWTSFSLIVLKIASDTSSLRFAPALSRADPFIEIADQT